MARTPRLIAVIAVTASGLIASPTASAAVTIGSDLATDPVNSDACSATAPCTAAILDIPGRQTTSPIKGVVVRWRLRAENTCLCPGTGVRFEVIRPAPAGAFTGVSKGSTQNIADGPVTTWMFDTAQPIEMGDRIALDVDTPTNNLVTQTASGGTFGRWDPPLAIGDTRPPGSTGAEELTMNADIEPDADCDGLGDETQDPFAYGGCLAATAVTPPPPKVATLSGGKGLTNGKSVALQGSCAPGGGDCDSNQVALRTAKPVSLGNATSAAAGKRIALGAASFSIPAGATQTVRVRLTKPGQRLFKVRKKVAATATITGGGVSTTGRLTIKLK